MGSPFIYELNISWSKDKKYGSENAVEIYGFKSGGEESLWQEVSKLDDIKMIVNGANGARGLTVATFAGIAGKTLENRGITNFRLYIRDTRIKDTNKDGKIVASITFKDGDTGKKFPAGKKFINMSNSSLSKDIIGMIYAVSIDFHNSDDGPEFKLE